MLAKKLKYFCVSTISVPDGPPATIEHEVVNSTAISFILSPPERTVVNGIITQYTVYYKTTEDDEASQTFFSNEDGQNTTVVVIGLRKFFDHEIYVTAHTRIGEGPRSQMLTIKTDEDGNCHFLEDFVSQYSHAK